MLVFLIVLATAGYLGAGVATLWIANKVPKLHRAFLSKEEWEHETGESYRALEGETARFLTVFGWPGLFIFLIGWVIVAGTVWAWDGIGHLTARLITPQKVKH